MAASTASAKTVRLNWAERMTGDYGYLPMTFKVRSVDLRRNAWAARASVTNRSRRTIRVVRPTDTYPQQFGFGLAHGYVPDCPSNARCGLAVLRATYARPRLPQALRPGQTWSGTFGGPGLPPRGWPVNVTFGYFFVSRQQRFSYVTQRSFRR
jgi:hypothetical protein